ncbi:MAG: WYL domain-containing protein [Bacteroides sp.]|nr:WYL domain-containing protein [Bacteroides sp.]
MGRKLQGLQRMLVILNKLKGYQRYVPREELEEYVSRRMEERDGTPVDLRTLQRGFNEIEELFGIHIRFSKKQNGYHIDEEDELKSEQYNRLLLNFDLLNAIKFSHPVTFSYLYVREEGKIREKRVLPHYLKEDQQRWYLLAYNDGILKTFSAACIRNLRIHDEETFKRDMSINVEELFKDSYGIWNQPDIPVEEIELSYDALNGSFLKSVPLHPSQEVLIDNETEFRIRLRLRITNDFVMALLSRSRSLTVIRPQHLREQVRKVYEEALKRNT